MWPKQLASIHLSPPLACSANDLMASFATASRRSTFAVPACVVLLCALIQAAPVDRMLSVQLVRTFLGLCPSADACFVAETTLHSQAWDTALLMAFWYAAFTGTRWLVGRRMEGKPWAEQAVDLTMRSYKKAGSLLPFNAAYDAYKTAWGISLQHALSGLLCTPAVFGFLDPKLAIALAQFAGLSEAAWEVMDTLERVYTRWLRPGGETGRREMPILLLLGALGHHITGMGMVVPMNCHYAHEQHYAIMLLLLQLAAGIGCASNCIIFTIDAKQPRGLKQVRLLCVLSWLMMVPSRGPLFARSVYHLLHLFLKDEAWAFFYVGCVAAVSMGAVNVYIIYDATMRAVKFLCWRPTLQKEEGGRQGVVQCMEEACKSLGGA